MAKAVGAFFSLKFMNIKKAGNNAAFSDFVERM
mgnify:FL=1